MDFVLLLLKIALTDFNIGIPVFENSGHYSESWSLQDHIFYTSHVSLMKNVLMSCINVGFILSEVLEWVKSLRLSTPQMRINDL